MKVQSENFRLYAEILPSCQTDLVQCVNLNMTHIHLCVYTHSYMEIYPHYKNLNSVGKN